VIHIVEWMCGAARLMLNPARLIDKFLDWLEEARAVLLIDAAHGSGLASSETRTEASMLSAPDLKAFDTAVVQ